MSRRQAIILTTVVVAAIGIVAAVAYSAGVAAGRQAAVAATASPAAQPVARIAQEPFFAPGPQVPPPQAPVPQAPTPGTPPLREFVPLPGPGDLQPGQQPGDQQGDCEPIILFYHNGQLYQLRPGPGPQNGPGRPTAPPEFYQLNPYQGPPIPGLPAPPQGPGFAPVNPRS